MSLNYSNELQMVVYAYKIHKLCIKFGRYIVYSISVTHTYIYIPMIALFSKSMERFLSAVTAALVTASLSDIVSETMTGNPSHSLIILR